MKIGIVGKPNVGKSAFFRSMTLSKVESGDFPFTTIDANCAIGYVNVKDPADKFNKISNPRDGFVENKFRFIPIELIDVAGLVPGASSGKGLGNKFLDDLRQADCLIHVVDISGSTNEKGEKVEINSHNPKKDILFLEEELNLWFNNILEKHKDNILKKIKLTNFKIEDSILAVVSGLNININQINIALKDLNITKENLENNFSNLAKKLREISKPMVIACNKCDLIIDTYQKKIEELKKEFSKYIIIPIIAEYEDNLRMAKEKKLINYDLGSDNFKIINKEKLNENQILGLEKINSQINLVGGTGILKSLNCAVFDLLKLKPIFPGGASKLEDSKGNILPDCFLMEKNSTALDFAYRLHTDFGKNFIRAIDVKTKMLIGKTHNLKFGDIIEIVSGK